MPYRYLDHTAEIGIAAEGATLQETFASAATGLVALLYDPSRVEEREERPLNVRSTDREALLVDWLNEVNYRVEVDGFAFRRFRIVELTADSLQAIGYGEPLDQEKHRAKEQVKAATYYDLQVFKTPGGYEVRVVLDI